MISNWHQHGRQSPFDRIPASNIQLALLITGAVTLLAFLGLHCLLKPVDKRPAPSGKSWKLPPGPKGLPLIGDLLLYRKGEVAVSQDHNPYSPYSHDGS